MRNLKISTSELAKICGVSQGTVDRALNGRPGINEKTKNKILSVAAEYGYRAGQGNSIKLIGVIVFDLNNAYFSNLITDIENELKKIGYLVTVMFTRYDTQCEIENIRYLYNIGVEGIIICPINSGEEFGNYLKSFDIPIVSVGNDIFSVPYVGVDDFCAMKEQTQQIIKEGYENIIYFSPAINYKNAYAQKQRYEGFKSAINDLEIPYEVIKDISEIQESYKNKSAVICSSDYYAL